MQLVSCKIRLGNYMGQPAILQKALLTRTMIYKVYLYLGRLFFGQISPTHLNSSWRILEFFEFFLEFFWISLEFFEKILEFFGVFLEFWCFGKDFKIVLEFSCSKAEPNKEFVIT